MKSWLVIGDHSIRESINNRPKAAKCLYLRQDFTSNSDLKDLEKLAKAKKLNIKLLGDKKLNQLCQGHQGAILETQSLDAPNWQKIYEKSHSLVLALDGIEDPHNLGSILRTAWLMEVDAVLIPKDRSVKMTPTVLKIASGGAEHVPVEEVTNLGRSLEELKKESYWVSGLAEGGHDKLHQWQAEEKAVIVVGAEDQGIRKGTREKCDRIIEIWQVAGGSSYNAAVAAALTMSQYRSHWLKN